jgi:hypothetical protein
MALTFYRINDINKRVNAMNKVVLIFSLLVLGGLVSGCASLNVAMVNNTAKPGVIIEIDGEYDLVMSGPKVLYGVGVYIDGKKLGTLRSGEIKGYEIAGGNHIIYFKDIYTLFGFWCDLVGALDTPLPTGFIRFTINNDRHYFGYESDGLEISHNITPVKESVSVNPGDTRLLNRAITNSFNTISMNIPVNSKIAIVSIASDSNVDSNFILEELTLAFVNSGRFIVVDRQTLNMIRAELNFQFSGEVSDETALSIGRFIGASVIITGMVSGNGEMRRLRLRALDVQTAQILAMSAEKI